MRATEMEMNFTANNSTELDFIEEIRMRRWAREHYVAADARDDSWHPVVLDEMRARDTERGANEDAGEFVEHHDQT